MMIDGKELMTFLQSFKDSMETKMEEAKHNMKDMEMKIETKIEATNRKIDGKLNEIGIEMKEVKEKIIENEEKGRDMEKRMDERLSLLEK